MAVLTAPAWVDAALTRGGNTEALVRPQKARLTYAALETATRKLAEAYAAQGVGAGDVVAVVCASPFEFVLAALGAWRAGAVLAPVDARGGETAVQAALLRTRAAFVCRQVSPVGELVGERGTAPLRLPPDVALLLWTSGSSGSPKGVLLGMAGVHANVEAILDYLPVRACPVTGVVLPLVYGYAWVGQVLTTLWAQGTVVLASEEPFPARQLQMLAEEGVTGLSSVPSSLRLLARAVLESPEAPCPSLGYVASAGAPLDAHVRTLLLQAFPRARKFNQYGLTEASPRVAAVEDKEPEFHRGSVGRAVRDTEVWAEDALGVRLPPGETGELCVRGPSVMRGYWGDAAGTSEVLRPDGTLRTRDIGCLDARGFIYVHGRLDGLVKCGGERVSLEEVSRQLALGAQLDEVPVVGVGDAVLGTRLYAFVEGPPLLEERVRRAARALPPVQRPACVMALPRLPRTGNGKLDRQALLALAEAR